MPDHWGTTPLHAAAHANQAAIAEMLIERCGRQRTGSRGQDAVAPHDVPKAKATAKVLEGHGAV